MQFINEDAVQAQRNVIVAIAAHAEGVEGVKKASELLDFAAPMWEVLGFSHLIVATRAYIGEQAADLIRSNNDYIKGERKNSSTRRTALAENEKLNGYLTPIVPK